jgi:prepilin-type N-terminal cleavage/methylation domain-containing protein
MRGAMNNKQKGFSIIEVLVGITLIAIALIGLAQLFTLSVMNNLRANDLSNATFLIQQEIDYLRSLTTAEMADFPQTSRGESNDEQIDLNQDGTIDYRRVTSVQAQGTPTPTYDVFVLVFPPSQLGAARSALLLNPDNYKVKAQIHTLISR